MEILDYALIVEVVGSGRFIAWCPAYDCFASEAASFDEAVDMLRADLTRYMAGHPDIKPGEC
jgi:hypothetical protein